MDITVKAAKIPPTMIYQAVFAFEFARSLQVSE
jgi:hypothetical protein